jgi:hypothetical protein
MFNLADILAQAQGNQGFDALTRQFGISPDQTKAAMDALLPAFSLGLNRATQSPAGMANLFSLFTAGPNYAQMFENPLAAAPAMMAAGQQALSKIFGSTDLTQAIAQQTAAVTGIGQEVMKQAMPLMATMLMGGLLKGAMNGQNPLGDLITATVGRMMPPMAPSAASDPVGSMMGMFTNFFGGMTGAQPGRPATSPVLGLDQLMELAKQMQAANPLLNGSLNPAPAAGSEASGPRTLGQQAADTWTATMGRMFETGREMQDQQFAQLEQLFAKFGAPPKA